MNSAVLKSYWTNLLLYLYILLEQREVNTHIYKMKDRAPNPIKYSKLYLFYSKFKQNLIACK